MYIYIYIIVFIFSVIHISFYQYLLAIFGVVGQIFVAVPNFLHNIFYFCIILPNKVK